jgi:hypothetical protein
MYMRNHKEQITPVQEETFIWGITKSRQLQSKNFYMRNHKEQTTPVQEESFKGGNTQEASCSLWFLFWKPVLGLQFSILCSSSSWAFKSWPLMFTPLKALRSFLFNACTVYVPVYRRLFFYFLCAVFIFSHNTCTIIRQKNTSHQGLLICSIFKSLQSLAF